MPHGVVCVWRPRSVICAQVCAAWTYAAAPTYDFALVQHGTFAAITQLATCLVMLCLCILSCADVAYILSCAAFASTTRLRACASCAQELTLHVVLCVLVPNWWQLGVPGCLWTQVSGQAILHCYPRHRTG